MPHPRFIVVALSAALMFLFLASCSSGPSAPQPGTPAFYWAAANQNWKAGDYVKTLNNLANITDAQNDFTARARPWQIVVSAGVGRAWMDLAQAFEEGARATRFRPAEFRRPMNAYRSSASRIALQLAEAVGKSSAGGKSEAVRLDFPWPPVGNAAVPAKLARVSSGTMPSPEQVDELERLMVQRAVILAASRVTGSAEDLAKAQAVFQSPSHALPAEQFNTGIAKEIFDLAAIYGPSKMDMPDKRNFLYSQAIGVLKLYPANKEAMSITSKIQKDQKKKTTI